MSNEPKNIIKGRWCGTNVGTDYEEAQKLESKRGRVVVQGLHTTDGADAGTISRWDPRDGVIYMECQAMSFKNNGSNKSIDKVTNLLKGHIVEITKLPRPAGYDKWKGYNCPAPQKIKHWPDRYRDAETGQFIVARCQDGCFKPSEIKKFDAIEIYKEAEKEGNTELMNNIARCFVGFKEALALYDIEATEAPTSPVEQLEAPKATKSPLRQKKEVQNV
jgi:hypothetical protein